MFYVLTKDDCIWCDAATELLSKTDTPFGVFDYRDHPMLALLMKKAGLRTVPQIWVDTPDGREYIGGYEDLMKWIATNSLTKPVTSSESE